jgi:acetamidase/formamidase
VGDAHAAQGDGEVNLTAVECAFESIELNISVIKESSLKLPRAETAPHWITMVASIAVDFRITQVVDGNKGVHGMLPKGIFNGRED